MEAITLGIAVSGLIIGIIGLGLGLVSVIKVFAMEKSTHQIQYMPVEDAMKSNPFSEHSFGDFMGVSEPSIEEIDPVEAFAAKEAKNYSEEIERVMPEFATTKSERKITSL